MESQTGHTREIGVTITVTNADLPGEAGEYDAYHNEAIYRDEATVG